MSVSTLIEMTREQEHELIGFCMTAARRKIIDKRIDAIAAAIDDMGLESLSDRMTYAEIKPSLRKKLTDALEKALPQIQGPRTYDYLKPFLIEMFSPKSFPLKPRPPVQKDAPRCSQKK